MSMSKVVLAGLLLASVSVHAEETLTCSPLISTPRC